MARIRNVSILKGAASKRARAVVAKTWMDLVTAKLLPGLGLPVAAVTVIVTVASAADTLADCCK